MLTLEQRSEFAETGVVRLREAVGGADVARMRDQLWETLARRHGVRREAPETWTVSRPAGFQALVRSRAFAAMASAAVREALDDLLGADRWRPPRCWGTPLVTFPDRGRRWGVPVRDWHFDVPADRSASTAPGLNVFVYLDSVRAGGGGTVVVTASHLLAARLARGDAAAPIRSRDLRRELARLEPWLQGLFCADAWPDRVRQFEAGCRTRDGIRLQGIELTGDAGDVVFMDLRVLHAAAPNVRDIPRLMLAQQIYRTR